MNAVYRFGRFELQVPGRTLLVDGAPCPLGARAFDVLLALIQRRERVVTKNELLDLAWPGMVVEENNLTVQISALRKALGSQAIATIPARGYQFTATCDADQSHPSTSATPKEGSGSKMARRLVAVACAGVCRWSELVERDAASASRQWSALRGQFVEPQIATFCGDVIEIVPERILIMFRSAIDAMAWSLDLQERLEHERRAGPMALRVRVGILVEDGVFDGSRLVGDAVHIAERLQRLGQDDQIIVADAVRDFLAARLPVDFAAIDELQPSNFCRPIKAYRAVARRRTAASTLISPRLMWDRRPTIAVLPFDTEASAENSYFGDGITEEIITSLALNRSLFVIARSSTLRFKGQRTSAESVAAQLGVRYILRGALRRMLNRLRINVELIDAEAARVIWADRFDGESDDLFSFQTRIAACIANTIDPVVREAETEPLYRRPTENLDAYDCVLRGLSLQFTGAFEDFELAGTLFQRAIELDPRYAQAAAHRAWWFALSIGEGRSTQIEVDRCAAERLSMHAMELDPRDAWILCVTGHIQSFLKKRFQPALDLFEHALELNPSCAIAWARSGTTLAYIGRGDEALERVRNAVRLSPFDPASYSFCTTNGIACIVIGHYDEAVVWLSRACRLNPHYRAAARMLISAKSLAGEVGEARALACEFLAQQPDFRISGFASWYPLQPPYLDRVLDGMRTARLPE